MRIAAISSGSQAACELFQVLRQQGLDVIAHGGDQDVPSLLNPPCRLVVVCCARIEQAQTELIARISGACPWLPIVLLTAEPSLSARLTALNTGVDECLPLEPDPWELCGRIRALVRRTHSAMTCRLCIGSIEVDQSVQQAYANALPLELTWREFALLRYLVLRAEEIVSRDEIRSVVWPFAKAVDSNVIEVHVGRLRQKLGPAAAQLRTIRGVGYTLSVSARARPPRKSALRDNRWSQSREPVGGGLESRQDAAERPGLAAPNRAPDALPEQSHVEVAEQAERSNAGSQIRDDLCQMDGKQRGKHERASAQYLTKTSGFPR